MKLKIKNFGPLTKGGTIDLNKRFYVFVGKNGSGKTYVANLMYGLSKYSFASSKLPEFEDGVRTVELTNDNSLFDENELSINFIDEILNEKNIGHKAKITTKVSYKEDFFNRLLELKLHSIDNSRNISLIKEGKSEKIILKIREKKNQNQSKLDFDEYALLSMRFRQWIYKLYYNSIFLPASRTSLLSFWRYIATTERKEKDMLFDLNANGELLSQNALKNFQSLYTRPVKDLIAQIESFDGINSKPVTYYSDLVEELEELMGGKIKVHEPKEGIGRKRFTFEMAESGEELELFLASSAVNQLSILYIYLKYWAEEKGNFLMIDEPEINLHPENQVKLVNILMKFADRNDNRVLINTHSTLMADIINNHIRIGYLQTKGEDKIEWLKKHQLDINENISYKDFGMYYFNGTAIEEYPVGAYGVAFKDFNEVVKEVESVEDELKDQIYNSFRQEES